jgi:subtilisin family serine protease
MTHSDLAAKVVSAGRDFANDDDDAIDDNGHGTHVAGIAAADTDNSEGIAGVAWNCKILPVKVTEADGTGYYSWIIDGIIWAADQGADVINLSLGGDFDDPFLEDACKYAFDRGVVLVASAGNDAGSVLYPAAYDSYVLAVAATDYNDEPADFSNFGPQVDVAAPGVYILGPAPQWFVGEASLPYLFVSGTSQAAPHVSGLAALIKSLKPELEPAEVMKIIRYTADDVNASVDRGRDDHIGYGRINMERALAPYILK